MSDLATALPAFQLAERERGREGKRKRKRERGAALLT